MNGNGQVYETNFLYLAMKKLKNVLLLDHKFDNL